MIGGSDVAMEFFTKIIGRESMLDTPLESVDGFGVLKVAIFDKRRPHK